MTLRRDITTNSSYTLKRRFALRFLKALMRIRKPKPSPYSSSSSLEIRRRAQRIKLAAYSSMARAVGSRRAWSRALMLKLYAGRSNRHFSRIKQKGSKKMTRMNIIAKKKQLVKTSSSGVHELRRLVPGGERMDPRSLLVETAHFVCCLETQVRVMRSIADGFPY